MDRDTILEAAAQIISEKGFHAASMQEIAEAVSLQKASLYYHVTSKQEILLALLDRALDILIDRMQAVLAQPLPPEGKLREAMIAYLDILTEHNTLASVLLLEHRSLDPELHDRHIPRRDKYENLWRTLIEEGIAAGVFRRNDPSFTARALLGVMNWTITWYRPEGSLSPKEIAEQYADIFLNGLLLEDQKKKKLGSEDFKARSEIKS